jgi:alkylation response protein AidB-like acyl-CoA dehydrogenase/quercetin dioxygenase-like cupin family protein
MSPVQNPTASDLQRAGAAASAAAAPGGGPPPVLGVGDVLAMLPAARARAGDWQKVVRFDPKQKIRIVVHRDEQTEILLQCWSPGQASGFHDHCRTVGVAEVLQGTIEETVLRSGRGPLGKARTHLVNAGGSLVFEDGKLHRMRCAGDGPAVTLHIYSPPLGAVGRYDPDDVAAGRTAAMYPVEHGGADLGAAPLLAAARALSERLAVWGAAAAPDKFPEASFRALDGAGLLLGPLRREDGGAGATLAECLEVLATIARGAPAVALCLATHYAVAGLYRLPPAAVPAAHRDAFEQQRSWLAFAVRSGLRFGAGLSALEALAGSARPPGAGLAAGPHPRGRGFALSGVEAFVSFGGHADYFLCAAERDGARELFVLDRHGPDLALGPGWNGFAAALLGPAALEASGARAPEPAGYPGMLEQGPCAAHWWPLGLGAVLLGVAERLLALAAAEAAPAAGGSGAYARAGTADAFLRVEAARAVLRDVAAADPCADPDAGPHRALARRAARALAYVTREVGALAAALGALAPGAPGLAALVRDATAGPPRLSPLAAAMDAAAGDLDAWLAAGAVWP